MNFNTIKALNLILIYIGITYLCGKKHDFYRIKFTIQLITTIFTGFVLSGQVAFIATNAEDFNIFAEAVLINLTFDIFFVKLLCHMVNRDDFKNIVDDFIYRDFETKLSIISYRQDNLCLGPKATELKKLLIESKSILMRNIKYCLLVYGGSAFTSAIIFDVKPIVFGILQPESHYRDLPLTISSPWNDKTTPNYQITYMIHVYLGIFSPSAYVGLDCLLALLLGHIIRQLRIVGFIMANLDELVAEVREKASEEWERDSTAVLASCAQHYTTLKRYCQKLNAIYKPFFVVQAVCSSSIMCLGFFMIATSEAYLSLRTLLYVLYEITATVQIGMYCTIGQMLKDESEKLQECVVGQWWQHGRRHRSCTRIFLSAVQRPITMYIWGSIELSYATFGAIARTSVSYFTLLKTVSET